MRTRWQAVDLNAVVAVIEFRIDENHFINRGQIFREFRCQLMNRQ